MNVWSQSSDGKLITCHPTIRTTFNVVLQRHNCSVVWGARGEEEQEEAFEAGLTTKHWPDSKHNTSPTSQAIDVIPYINGRGIVGRDPKDIKYFYRFSGVVLATALELFERGEIKFLLRWGGDWDNDFDLDDQRFFDLYHYEIISPDEFLRRHTWTSLA